MRKGQKERPVVLPRVYEIVFTLLLGVSAPFYFLKMWRRGNWREGFGQRLGRFSSKTKQNLTNRKVIWLHAVSVGEVNLCTQLISALERQVPNFKLVVSTTTATGMGELKKKLPSHIEKIYYPIDRRRYVSRALSTIRPEAIVLVEAEIWPNFLWAAQRRHIPTFLVNARLSDRSYRGYRRFSFLFQPIFRSFAGIGVQTREDAEKFQQLGCRRDAIHVVGSLKFDAAVLTEQRNFDVWALLQRIGVSPERPILLGASTHMGEEAILAELYQRLKQSFPRLLLILVPRHFERSKAIGQELKQLGVRFVYRSDIRDQTGLTTEPPDCLLVNTTGELKYFFEPANVTFVGKSLTAHGGQNPIEPGSEGKAMILGPHMENFSRIAEQFLKHEGAIQVQDKAQLEQAIAELLQEPDRQRQMGENATRVVRENLGAIEKTCEMIIGHLPKLQGRKVG